MLVASNEDHEEPIRAAVPGLQAELVARADDRIATGDDAVDEVLVRWRTRRALASTTHAQRERRRLGHAGGTTLLGVACRPQRLQLPVGRARGRELPCQVFETSVSVVLALFVSPLALLVLALLPRAARDSKTNWMSFSPRKRTSSPTRSLQMQRNVLLASSAVVPGSPRWRLLKRWRAKVADGSTSPLRGSDHGTLQVRGCF